MNQRSWQVSVDEQRCVGSGICAGTAPGHFSLVDGVSQGPASDIDPAETVIDAAESCPVEAILVRDADGTPLAPLP
ncbi:MULTISPECIES: ferredoxin [unclassified Solwaraspora]|uniref:ferredoxin n=1 Tax=unclassified Solwaraspora TaxID=2627926 RepID=UPI00248A9FE3|nr:MULTISPECIES: ferredoxin [unclassified Solwaraspora]WBB99619.1 ferredoxin [Solwaraspora sp. WMMA2059]WBC21830.1 ferredoxin [Solwaraspora sp. WMMA2080]WJK36122.1 ferredoxin [Solwaraspora sp. WMMA2065]